jgi:hypothetical protein
VKNLPAMREGTGRKMSDWNESDFFWSGESLFCCATMKRRAYFAGQENDARQSRVVEQGEERLREIFRQPLLFELV